MGKVLPVILKVVRIIGVVAKILSGKKLSCKEKSTPDDTQPTN
jgi:hypothetical protein